MLISILSGAPLWVWPLLAFLVFFGLNATRARETLSLPIYLLPLLGLLSLNAVNSLQGAGYLWIVFAVAYLFGALAGFGFQRRVISDKSAGRVTLKGEWITFIVLMTVFWMNFAGGAVQAISPETYASAGFHILFASIAGLAAGSFIGRALRVFLTTSSPASSNSGAMVERSA